MGLRVVLAGVAAGGVLLGCGARQTPWEPPPDDAIAAASRVVFRSSNDATRAAWPSAEVVEELVRDGTERIAAGDYRGAVAPLRVASRAAPNSYRFRPAFALALWRGEGDAQAALDETAWCLELSPTNLDCMRVRGLVLRALDAHDEAIPWLQEVVAYRDHDDATAEALARSLFARGRFAETCDVMEAVVTRNPNAVGLWLLYATALEEVGREGEAEAAFRHLADHHRDPIRGAGYLQAFYERIGEASKARRVERTIERMVRDAQPRRNLRPIW